MARKNLPAILVHPKYQFLHLIGVFLVLFFLGNTFLNQLHASNTILEASTVIGQLVPTTNTNSTLNFNAGSANNGGGATIGNIGVSSAVGSAFDSANNRLFLSDYENNRVLVYNLSDTGADYYIADYVLGQSNFTSDGSGISETTMNHPTGLAFDSNNQRLFVADYSNDRVLVFDVRNPGSIDINYCGGMTMTLGISNGMSASCVLGASDFNGSATVGGMPANTPTPFGLYYDTSTNHLFVSQLSFNRVTVFRANLNIFTTNGIDAIHVFGQEDFTGTSHGWEDFTSGSGEVPSARSLYGPKGLTLDSTNSLLYVADTGDGRVVVYNTADIENTTGGDSALYAIGKPTLDTFNWLDPLDIGGPYTETPRQDSLFTPNGVTLDATNNLLYVSDGAYNRITVYDVRAEGSAGRTLCSYVSHGIVTGMNASCVIGQGSSFTSTTSGTSSIKMNVPQLLDQDTGNNLLYAGDFSNNRYLTFSTASLSNGIAATNNFGQVTVDTTYSFAGTTDFAASGSNSTTPTVSAIGFDNPRGMSIDTENHRMFVSDTNNNRILVFNLNTDNTLIDNEADFVLGQANFTDHSVATTATGLSSPRGITYWHVPAGIQYLFVADYANNRTIAYDVTSITNGEAAVSVIGQTSFTLALSKAGNPDQYNLTSPIDVTVDTVNNRLFVSDTISNRIMVFDIATLTETNMAAMAVVGQDSYITDASATTATGLNEPSGIFYEPVSALLYVADTRNNRVLAYDSTLIADGTHGTTASHVLGQTLFTTSTGSTSQSGMASPLGFGYDTENKILFVTSAEENRVLEYDVNTITDGENAIAVIGQLDFSAIISGVSDTALHTPIKSFFDNGNRFLYVVDSVNSRLLKYEFITLTTTSISSSAQVGVAYSAPLSATNNQGTVSYELFSGTMPAGVTFDATGIVGTPTVAGAYTFVVRAVDTIGDSGFRSNQKSYSMTVAAAADGGGVITGTGSSGQIPLCTDPNATNYNAFVACIYNSSTITNNTTTTTTTDPVVVETETCATNPNLAGCNVAVINTTPTNLCLDVTAQNYNGALPCIPRIIPTDITPLENIDLGNIDDTIFTGDTINTTETTITPTSDFSGSNGVRAVGQVLGFFSALGLAIGVFLVSLGAFAGALSLSEILLIPARLWTLFLGFLGFRKKIKHWGIIYDSVTKQPLDPVYVSLFDSNNKEVATAITDLEGRYGFLVQAGMYRIEAHKTNYIFPSQKLSGKEKDEIYNDLYFGKPFEIKAESEVVTKNIPLDQEHFDWNEYVKHEKKLTSQHLMREKILNTISGILFFGGLVSSLVALVANKNTFTIIAVVLYAILFFLRWFVIRKPSFGTVSVSGEPIPFGIVKIYSARLGTLLSTRVLDKFGRYYALVPKSNYFVKIEEKKDDQNYSPLYRSDSFVASKGVINKKFKI